MPNPDLNQFSKEELNNFTETGEIPERFNESNSDDSISIPFILGGAIGVFILILFAWPVLLVGMILGIFSTIFLFCKE